VRDNIKNMPFSNFVWFMGVVEDIDDPLKINRELIGKYVCADA